MALEDGARLLAGEEVEELGDCRSDHRRAPHQRGDVPDRRIGLALDLEQDLDVAARRGRFAAGRNRDTSLR